MNRTKRRYSRDPVERFERDVDREGPNGCWTWRGNHDPSGYARVSAGTRTTMKAATWAYEHSIGPVPEGHHLDHLCHTRDTACPGGRSCPHRGCVNPWHLEPVLPHVNALRGRGFAAANAEKDACPRGHLYTEENTYRPPRGGRNCRECRRDRSRQWKKDHPGEEYRKRRDWHLQYQKDRRAGLR